MTKRKKDKKQKYFFQNLCCVIRRQFIMNNIQESHPFTSKGWLLSNYLIISSFYITALPRIDDTTSSAFPSARPSSAFPPNQCWRRKDISYITVIVNTLWLPVRGGLSRGTRFPRRDRLLSMSSSGPRAWRRQRPGGCTRCWSHRH